MAVEAALWVSWRKYAFTLSIYVFDTQHHWKATHVELDNAEFQQGNFEVRDFGQCLSPDRMIELAGLRTQKPLYASPTITYYNLGNNSELFQGLGAGMQFERDDGNESAVFKFIVPRWSQCKIKIEANIASDGLKAFYQSDNWISDKPRRDLPRRRLAGRSLPLCGARYQKPKSQTPHCNESTGRRSLLVI